MAGLVGGVEELLIPDFGAAMTRRRIHPEVTPFPSQIPDPAKKPKKKKLAHYDFSSPKLEK